MNRLLYLFLTLTVLTFTTAIAATQLNQPSCQAIDQWANTYKPGKNLELLPDWPVNDMYADEVIVPLFGIPLKDWDRSDNTAFQGWLANCRKEAGARKDKPMLLQLGKVIKEAKNTYKQLSKLWDANIYVERIVANILRNRNESDEYIEVLKLTADAINGEDITERVNSMPRQWYGTARQATQILPFTKLLTPEQRQVHIDKLEIKQETVVTNVTEKEQRQQELMAQIAAVPNSQAGYGQLMGIYNQTDTSKMSAEEYDAFNRAFQAKRRLIQTTAEAAAAAEKSQRMNTPAPVVTRLNTMLKGDDVDAAQIEDLVLDASLSSVEFKILGPWKLNRVATMALDRREYTTTRNQLEASLKAASHDGGYVTLRTYHGKVGEVTYDEHYPGPMPVTELKTYLLERFDDPEKILIDRPGAINIIWRDGDRFLQISADNSVSFARQLFDVQSHVSIKVWSEDFDDYIKAGDARCEKIASKPQQSLSVKEKQDYMMSCREP